MTKIWARSVRAALDEEMGVDPSPEVWERVKATLPDRRPARWLRVAPVLAGVLAVVLAIGTSGMALAYTETGQKIVTGLVERFGWKLVEWTPELEEQVRPRSEVGESDETDTYMAITLNGIRKEMPAGMRLPVYLPESLSSQGVLVRRGVTDWSYSVEWHTPIGQMPSDYLIVQWFHATFDEGSRTITVGPARDVQEVDINGSTGLAFQDDEKWQVDWETDGYHFTVVTDISLEELLKVARSLE